MLAGLRLPRLGICSRRDRRGSREGGLTVTRGSPSTSERRLGGPAGCGAGFAFAAGGATGFGLAAGGGFGRGPVARLVTWEMSLLCTGPAAAGASGWSIKRGISSAGRRRTMSGRRSGRSVVGVCTCQRATPTKRWRIRETPKDWKKRGRSVTSPPSPVAVSTPPQPPGALGRASRGCPSAPALRACGRAPQSAPLSRGC